MKNQIEKTNKSGKNILEISIEDLNNNFNDIFNNNVAIWRKNIENHLVTIPMNKLKQYIGNKNSEGFKFFVETNWKDRIKEADSKKIEQKEESPIDPKEQMKEFEELGKVDEQIAKYKMMSIVEREEILDNCISQLSEGQEKEKSNLGVALVVKMVEVLTSTFYANNANLEDNVSTTNVKDNIYGVLIKTNWIVQILIEMFDQKKYSYNDLKIIDEIATGSNTIDHINKALLRFITFCVFFNEYIGDGLFTKNIRGAFKDRYKRHYQKRMPDKNVTLEVIFKNGIRRIDKENEIQNYAVGALLYDIGKLKDIDYHDGTEDYDENRVKSHVLNGYNMITNAKKYPFEVLAMAAFHHEYYGGKGGYNFAAPLLSRFIGKKISFNNFQNFISFEKEDFKNGVSLAYFPCKVLEMIDVFDALVGKKSMETIEALKTIKKEFITKNLKIDPILFRIFLEYNVKCGTLESSEFEEIDSIIF